MAVSKLWTYSVFSLFGLSAFVGNAVYINKQFYTTVVWLMSSKIARVLLANACFVVLAVVGNLLKSIFFGALKPRETEKIHENAVYFVATTCLALTIFREHITSTILAMFVICFFVKIFHWLSLSRQEHVEQSIDARDNSASSIRLLIFQFLLAVFDVSMSVSYVSHLLSFGTSVRLLLALEYLVMTVTCTSTIVRLCLHAVDARCQHRWENKGKYRFYLEIVSELLQCLLYMGFFGMLLAFYGFPLHLLRELYVTVKSFVKTVGDFVRYRKLTAFLDQRYPDATAEEIQQDPHCIICYDDMLDNAKKLSCGHIFHKHCLKSWMERNNKCPLCNKPTLDPESYRAPSSNVQPSVNSPPLVSQSAQETTNVSTEEPPGTLSSYQIQRQRAAMQIYSRLVQLQSQPRSICVQSSSSVSQQNFSGSAAFPSPAQPVVLGLSPCSRAASIEAFVEYQQRLAEYHANMAQACKDLALKLTAAADTQPNSFIRTSPEDTSHVSVFPS